MNSTTNNNTSNNGNTSNRKPHRSSKPSQSSSTPQTITRIKCGCMSTRHKFMGSCLSCGRIHCEQEINHKSSSSSSQQQSGVTMSMCLYCDGLVMKAMTSEEAQANGFDQDTIRAYQHKDKLLQFDREHAKRTHVHDAQGDYYHSGTWLTEEEKKRMEKKERERRQRLTETKHVKTMTLDITSGKFVAVKMDDKPEETVGDEEIIHPADAPPTISCAEAARRDDELVDRFRSAALSDDVRDVASHRTSDGFIGSSSAVRYSNSRAEDNPETELLTAIIPATAVENDILSGQQSKAGDVYRLLKLGTEVLATNPRAKRGGGKAEFEIIDGAHASEVIGKKGHIQGVITRVAGASAPSVASDDVSSKSSSQSSGTKSKAPRGNK